MNIMIKRSLPLTCALTALHLALTQAYAGPLTISNVPLFLISPNKANVLMMYGNSNSMDSDPTGRAVGSAAASSKSEIARKAIKNLIDNYTGYVNMGLMGYRQNAAGIKFLNDSQYDVSYDSNDYNPSFNGPRNSKTKKFRLEMPAGSGKFIYYNVNLPAYENSATSLQYCYAATACTSPTNDFKGHGSSCTPEHPSTGPWDTYTCYPGRTTSQSNDLSPTTGGYTGTPTTPTYSATDADLGQGITDFGKRITGQYVSKAWMNNTNLTPTPGMPGLGYLHLPVAFLDATQAAALKVKLGTSQFTNNKPTDLAYPLQNSGLSPLAGAAQSAKSYFLNDLKDPAQGGKVPAPVIPNSCRKNFFVTLTDGLPSVTTAGAASANTTALLTELTDKVKELYDSSANVETYVVGFALPYGVSITQLDTIAAAGGSGTAYYADNPATLEVAFKKIFADIISKTSAASSVALNSHSVATGAHVYQARFSSGDWSGQLLKMAFVEEVVGGKTYRRLDQTTPLWDAGQRVTAQSLTHATSRTIITRKSNGAGVLFKWPTDPANPTATELDPAQITALHLDANGNNDGRGQARLEYVRGSDANEGTAGFKFRARPTSKLGDIVNSAPVYVGTSDLNSGLPGYSEFRELHKDRTPMVYVGANDGMLHGFNAATGDEVLAYIPTALVGQLSKLTSPTQGHRYFVDGSPATSDVEVSAGNWRTMLVSGMGTGARGLFGIDITEPDLFSQTSAPGLVKFELSDADDSDLGYISGPITITKLNNGQWAAVFGNGLNSSGNSGNGNAYLYLVDVNTGALIKKIQAKLAGPPAATTSPNGLSAPILIDLDGNETADVAYAGDLLGNMWKFDLTSTGQGSWKVDYKLFQAPHPITSMPDAGEHPEGGFMVYFGTGKYLEPTDVQAPAAGTTVKAMYGIRDVWEPGSNSATTVLASRLVTQTMVNLPGPLAGGLFRKISKNAVDYLSKDGFVLEFMDNVERSVSPPQLRDGRLIFTTIVPSDAPCSPGGDSWFYEVNWLTGGELGTRQLNTNGDRLVDDTDELVGGQKLDGVVSPPAIQTLNENGGHSEVNLVNASDGKVKDMRGAGDAKRTRRLSWRQVKK